MRKLILLIIMICLAQPLWAQDSQAQLAIDRIEAAYKALGPELGSYLYEPDFVLVFADIAPSHSVDLKFEVGPQEVDEANQLLEKEGIRLKIRERGDIELKVDSLQALETRSQVSKLTWVSPFESSSGWVGFDDWSKSRRDHLREQGKNYGEYARFLRAYPDAAIAADMARRLDPVVREDTVYVYIPYSDHLHGGHQEIRVLTKDIDDAEVLTQAALRGQVLGDFYQAPTVKSRLADPEFVEGRKAARPGRYVNRGERWIRGEFGFGSSEFEFRDDFLIFAAQERVLVRHVGELVSLIEAGASPGEFASRVYELSVQEKNSLGISQQILKKWLWSGGSKIDSHRGKLYQAARKKWPGFLEKVAEDKLSAWVEDQKKDKDYFFPGHTVILFNHPSVQEEFRRRSDSERQEILEFLKSHTDKAEIRELLNAPMFKA